MTKQNNFLYINILLSLLLVFTGIVFYLPYREYHKSAEYADLRSTKVFMDRIYTGIEDSTELGLQETSIEVTLLNETTIANSMLELRKKGYIVHLDKLSSWLYIQW